jgi:SAM-dependent methyltransferase
MKSWLKGLLGRFPKPIQDWIARLRRPRIGHMPFRRLEPISRRYGVDRGHAIDRFYIERFLNINSHRIRGVCLEVRDDTYTRRFGGDRVTRCDVLDVNPSNPQATICGDLRRLTNVGEETYDCIILTQVLQYIDDLRAAIGEVHRILKPGGCVLITAPSVAQLDHSGNNDFWRFNTNSMRYILTDQFEMAQTEIQSWGSVLTSVACWIGLAREDLKVKHLEHSDPHYPCLVSAVATKAQLGDASGSGPVPSDLPIRGAR